MSKRFWTTGGGLVLAAAAFAMSRYGGLTDAQSWTAAVTVLCAVWWIFEAIPIPATSLVPFAVFPLVGVLSERQVATAYGHPLVLLFLGGFMLSRAAESCGAHRRIAHAILHRVGTSSGPRVVLAFMLATALCSMWISNTATALMMLPVALAVLEHDTSGKLGTPLMLGIAYSASIGGLATPIGTPPNGVFLAIYETITGVEITFAQWMGLALVVTVVMFVFAWALLTFRLKQVPPVRIELEGGWTTAQRRMLAVFGLAALAWITRSIPFGGWSHLLHISTAGDSTVALLAAVSLFLIPTGEEPGQRLLDWQSAAKIPWGILVLFGGGIALATAFESSGLSGVVGQQLGGLHDWPLPAVILVICLVVPVLTEVTSNTATANILLPVLGAAAKSAHFDPALLMIPATLSASCAFMLPIATPPNAVVFGSGRVRIADMARLGVVLNLFGVVVITLVCWLLVPVLFGAAPTGG